MQILGALDPLEHVQGSGFGLLSSRLVVALVLRWVGGWKMRFERKQRGALRLGEDLIRRRDFVADDGVEGNFLGEFYGFAEDDDGEGVRAGQHGYEGGADTRVEAAVGHHGVRAEEHLRSVFDGVRGTGDEVVPHVDALVSELPREGLPLEERL